MIIYRSAHLGFCAGPNEASWLNSFLTQHQLPFSVKLVTLDVDQGVGRRSWR